MSKYNRIKGTQDIFGDEIKYWTYIDKISSKIFLEYGFHKIITPIIEKTELFQRSIGDNTDIVQKEMYTFLDKGNRSNTLRPEGTAPVVRAYIENSFINLGSPNKLYYNGPMFRYEKPQSGRLRQFHQIGAEIFGTDHPLADAEIIELIYKFLNDLNLKHFIIKINSVGCPECREKYKAELRKFYSKYINNMCEDCQVRYNKNIMRLIDCKKDNEISKNAPSILEYLCESCKDHFNEFKTYLNVLNVPYEIDTSIVRGLDYYTKSAFEIEHIKLGAQSVIAAGGRYDLLVKELGGNNVPAVGFAGGIERIVLALKKEEINIEDNETIDVYVISQGKESEKKAAEISSNLRKKGIKTFLNVSKRNIGSQLKHANKIKAKYSSIIGQEELEKGFITIKNMQDGKQTQVKEEWFVNLIIEKLET